MRQFVNTDLESHADLTLVYAICKVFINTKKISNQCGYGHPIYTFASSS